MLVMLTFAKVAENPDMAKREDVLGFHPQKESPYSKLLPYSDVIDEESSNALAEIKEKLAKAVQLRDLKVSANHWTLQLDRYIRVYEYKMSKEDHLYFVHLVFELIITPRMEAALVQRFAATLSILLKKAELLSRDDLVLPWRPLYQLMEDTIYSPMNQHGLQLLPLNFESTLKNLVRTCRKYFSDESTQEMLEEWRPLLCPFDVTVIRGLTYYEFFLPSLLPPEKHHLGFKLWFQEVLDIWNSFLNCPSWESSIVNLLARLAHDNVGYIDWKPYIPMIFTRILRSFNLPVGNQNVSYTRGNSCYDIYAVSLWLVSMMGDGDLVMQHLEKLFRALNSFFHPSNVGRWSHQLSSFLQMLPAMVVRRLHRERFKKPSWLTPVPESHHLSNALITQFVEMLKPAVFTAMFGKGSCQDSAVRHLAMMRPEIITPPLLEKMYPAMETLIEPHRLISCMRCIVAAARPMLSSQKYFPEGPTHAIPLLQLALPGIDPNDLGKTMVTLQMISTFATLIPIVDCSEAPQLRSDLNQHEQDVCSATAQFEDFVLEFLNRVMSMIEASAQVASYGAVDFLTPEQSMIELGLTHTVSAVLQQCSKPIFMSALHKISRFVNENIHETHVSGRLAANLCRAAAKVRPEETLKLLLPQLCLKIQAFVIEHPDVAREEHHDHGFLWSILMLTQLVHCDGKHLLPYKEELLATLPPLLQLQCVRGYETACEVMRFLLRALTLTFPLSSGSVIHDLDQPLTDYLPIRDWAAPGDIDNLNMKWHVPNDEELSFANTVAEKFLVPELNFLKQISSSNEITKEDLLRRLHIILEFLLGAASVLPPWEGEIVTLQASSVPLTRLHFQVSQVNRELTLQQGNVREAVADVMQHVLNYMIESRADDTKGFFKIIRIYETLLMVYGIQKSDFDTRWKSFHFVKKSMQNLLSHKRKHIRSLLVERVSLLHELRSLNSSPRNVTTRHIDMIQDLFRLSVSRYREVRKRSQSCLQQCFAYFSYSYLTILPHLVTNLTDSNVEEHVFKGTLHMVLGAGKKPLATKLNWKVLGQLWPAIGKAQQFEKPSIIRIIDDIITNIAKTQETVAINMLVSQASLQCAEKLTASVSAPKAKGQPLSDQDLLQGENKEAERNAESLRLYNKLIDDLVALVEGGELTPIFTQNCMDLLSVLLRDDTPVPPKLVYLFTKHCVDDLLCTRKLALSGLLAILKQQKRRKVKVLVDIAEVSGAVPCLPSDPLMPGDRPDNRWHKYNSACLPLNKADWDACTFVPKTHLGYYCWPKDLKKYADESKQPKLVQSAEEMKENERAILESFSKPEYVQQLIHYLALEEHKGQDKFRSKHLTLFKGLFRNYGDSFLEVFKPHLERLVWDTSHNHHDSSQRCAMEIIAGLVRGTKHWPYEKIEKMWAWLIPLLSFALNNITIETLDDWGTFFTSISESRDPRQLHWLFELLMSNLLSGGGAFRDSSRLFMLQQALIQQEWRVPELLHRLLEIIMPHLSHPYKAVRDRLGSILANIFLYDYHINEKSRTESPQRGDFMVQILEKLDQLKIVQLDKGDCLQVPKAVKSALGNPVENSCEQPIEQEEIDGGDEASEEKKDLIRLCKTVLKWLTNCCVRGFSVLTKDVFPLLPVLCNLQSEMNDEDLRNDCRETLTILSTSLLTTDVLPVALHTIRETEDIQTAIRELLVHLLCDEQLEVREVAAQTLSGMMHCGFLQMNSDMLDHFKHLRCVKLKKRNASIEPEFLEKLIKRHAGVLGLSACVQAYPYDVPDFIPQVLMDLSVHVNDPQPIQRTVKKTLSDFRRTHHDNWHDHKQMFTDDQLVSWLLGALELEILVDFLNEY
ncbi:hypothetical protein C0Q70_13141 [Pomacea canaliculata]|uniref:Proteasome activator complex subunit 4 C-terminal domain-containing protein n=1 Tax=Pomacea canaliculata TaxID=400727 RepID=A0A2T7NWD9_POMCA|nr:hypothetical protein C0Q70_13141 [Pomacea canaliculata]